MLISHTLTTETEIKGIGIHSGKQVHLLFKPSTKGLIRFINTQSNSILEVKPSHSDTLHNRATILHHGSMTIETPEHLLAACAALSINSMDIFIDNKEVPIMDGSARPFMDLFLTAGLTPYNKVLKPIKIQEPITLIANDSCIIATPAPQSIFSYYLSYQHPVIGTQSETTILEKDSFYSTIAAARTFGFENEIQALIKQGLAQGGSLENALVIGKDNYINTPRFSNECAKHKLLDLIGDCWILNRPIIGHITGIKSGHQLNNKFISKIATL